MSAFKINPFYIVSLELSPDFGVWSQSATGDGLRSKGDVQQVTSEGRRATSDVLGVKFKELKD